MGPVVRPSLTALKLLAASAALVLALPLAQAQETPVKFQLDWRFEGPAALFLVPAAKGYFKAEKLNVTVDAGNGSGGAVTRVASGSYDMGFADLAALMEFHANNPTAPNKPVAVMMVYNNTPAAVLALKKSGIKTPADLNGKKLGAPVFDAGRKAFPIFAKANSISGVAWTSIAGATCSECHGGDLTGIEKFTPNLDVAGMYSNAELTTLLTTGKGKTPRDLGLMSLVGKGHFSYLTQHERDAVIGYVQARAARTQ